jgi:hypothetical protein
MAGIVRALKPKSGFAHVLHLALTALLPALMFVFIRIDFEQIALALVILSKWRMLAVRPRHWWPNIRANAVDIIVGIAFLTFMANTYSASWQLFWAASYAAWLLILKPRSDLLGISLQAVVGQLCGLIALFVGWREAPLMGLVFAAGLICYVAARHFFTSFDEPYTSLFAHTWGYFAAALIWVLGHWLLFYNVVAQPTLLLTVIGYGLAAMYYLDQHERLTVLLRRQFVFIMVAIVVVILAFSSWGDKTI